MGRASLTYLNTGAILLAAYLAVFLQSSTGLVRHWLGTQLDLLPVLMVYCALSTGLATLTLTAVVGGLCFDSLSANPLGITVLPQFLVGFAIYRTRDLILRDQPYARVVLGAGASALAPLLTVLLLWGGGFKPLIGWGSLWQWLMLTVTGGVLTPFCFWLFDRLHAALAYRQLSEATYRTDREIKRGRA